VGVWLVWDDGRGESGRLEGVSTCWRGGRLGVLVGLGQVLCPGGVGMGLEWDGGGRDWLYGKFPISRSLNNWEIGNSQGRGWLEGYLGWMACQGYL